MARPPHSVFQPDAAAHRVGSDLHRAPNHVQHGVIQPWGIRVQRSLGTCGQAAMGPWKAVSDSLFTPFADASLHEGHDHNHNGYHSDNSSDSDNMSHAAAARRVHHGLVDSLVDIERIAEIDDARLDAFIGTQAVRFDATALLTAQGAAPCVAWGGWLQHDLEAIACEDVWGVLLGVGLSSEPAASATPQATRQLAKLLHAMDCSLACGNVACLIDVGSAGMWWRATQIQAAVVMAPDGRAHLVLALAGSPVLPHAGAWRVTHEMQLKPDIEDNGPADHAPISVIRRNGERLWQIADCRDLFAQTAQGANDTPPHTKSSRAHTFKTAHPPRRDFALNTGLQELHFFQPQLERLAMKSSGEYGRLKPGHDGRFELWNLSCTGAAADTASAHVASGLEVLHTQVRAAQMPTLGIDGLHFETRWNVTTEKPSVWFNAGKQQVLWRYDPTGKTEASVRVTSGDWQISLGPLCLDLQTRTEVLMSLTADRMGSGSTQTAHLARPVWHWGRGLQAVQALWPDLLDALNSAGAASSWPVVATDTYLYLQHHACAARLAFGWGSVQHAQIEFGGWTSSQPAQAWFGVSLGSAAYPLTLVLPAGVGDAFVHIGVGDRTCSNARASQLDSQTQVNEATGRIQLQISCFVNLAFKAGEGSTKDVGSAAARAVIQARDCAPNRLCAEVGGMVHASVLGGLARIAVAMQSTAQVVPTTEEVLLDAGVNVGICLSTAALLDIDFDTEWLLSAALSRSA